MTTSPLANSLPRSARTCIACGASDLVWLGLVAPSHRAGFDQYEIVECRRCGLGFSDPLPSAEEVAAFYRDPGAYHDVYGVVDQPWQRQQHRLDLLRVARTRGGRLGRLLDVGCSFGLLLEVARDLGWDVAGVEMGPAAAEVARRRVGPERVFIGSVHELPPTWGPFDVISMSHVWEHLTDYRAVLTNLSERLVPGGVIAIQAPNRRALMTHWWGLDYRPVEHPFYWTYRALFLELRRAGLRPRVAPPLWTSERMTRLPCLLKELALVAEHVLVPRVNLGLKSTLEVHALKV